MNWNRRPNYLISDPPGYVIAKSVQDAETIMYVAIRSGDPWKRNGLVSRDRYGDPVAWDGSTILLFERNLKTDDEKVAALARCKSICEEDSRNAAQAAS